MCTLGLLKMRRPKGRLIHWDQEAQPNQIQHKYGPRDVSHYQKCVSIKRISRYYPGPFYDSQLCVTHFHLSLSLSVSLVHREKENRGPKSIKLPGHNRPIDSESFLSMKLVSYHVIGLMHRRLWEKSPPGKNSVGKKVVILVEKKLRLWETRWTDYFSGVPS